ncbi:uncharacterized protein C2845_PM15G02000 [Panicum miliaceum]|uniref:Uncharacterized protein n=1 Tax=Panicum miliaceum TaxID=4540 RepID=A0A3L6QAJ0_PANMI|nr:uncharacterized protein C2845_PM15G02000 [Panicum miliaceum]
MENPAHDQGGSLSMKPRLKTQDSEVKLSLQKYMMRAMDHWDLETTENPKKKIWKVAMECYKGWRSTLHATYKAYNSYGKRMKNKPEHIDIVEWHYLNKYFATRQFKSKNSNNSENRKQLKTSHSAGSKPFSQWSWEKRDPVTGAEPRFLEIWRTTHTTRVGEWTDEVAESIYEKVEKHEADKPIELEQLKAALRQELMGEFEIVMAPYRQELLPENAQPIPATSNNTTEVDARSTGDNPDATLVLHNQETRNQIAPRSILTTDTSNLAPSKNASTANVAKSLFNENRGRGAGAAAGSKYISSHQLVSGAKTRAGKKKAQQLGLDPIWGRAYPILLWDYSTRLPPTLMPLRSKSLSDLEKDLDLLLKLGDEDATASREAPILDAYSDSDDNPDSSTVSHLGLRITTTTQGRFMYWKGMGPSELLDDDARLVATI